MRRVVFVFFSEEESHPVAHPKGIWNRADEQAPLAQGLLYPIQETIEEEEMLHDLASDDCIEGGHLERPFGIEIEPSGVDSEFFPRQFQGFLIDIGANHLVALSIVSGEHPVSTP